MLKKKQVITVVSIAAISFLIGTLFNMNFIVSGGKGKDKDEDLWKAISELESRVETLEEQLLPQGFMTTPAWDSGWLHLNNGWSTFQHGLNTTEVFVYITGLEPNGYINQLWMSDSSAWWRIESENELLLYLSSERSQRDYNFVRVMLWRIPEPT